ncbi:histone deacetylase family protein [Teladorsagia circumcincta]|uniref:Histone deacetylase family protein n=1 Tax=Teladorsagia circumcincta TaxID=45464 RepID=A0A2G9UWV8_TELCI|nr:histone deacetylase family protein [Teladorsagia circumcincta]
MLVHAEDLIHGLDALKTDEDCEDFCRDKEILWLCPESAKAARLAAGGTIDLVKANVEGRVGNSFAIVRPPGHHAFGKTPQGYCLYNNVAVAAKYAVERLHLNKVAVVDFDYHAGNGTHYALRGDPRFHFTSFHAYHHGAFWPWNDEFDFCTDYDNTVMFPLNGPMNSESDFVSAFHHLVIPVLKEWKPELILVSAGFDSGYFDIMLEEGQGIKAHGFGHMVRLLDTLCPNRVVAVLEGGYFPANYTESASLMVRGLKGLPLPHLALEKLSSAFKETLWNCILHQSHRYDSIKQWLEKLQANQKERGLEEYSIHPTVHLGRGVRELWEEAKRARTVRTREWFPELTPKQRSLAEDCIAAYIYHYDYKTPTEAPEEQFLIDQKLWTERSFIEAYVNSAPICLRFINDFTDFLDGKKGAMMICDRRLMRLSGETYTAVPLDELE